VDLDALGISAGRAHPRQPALELLAMSYRARTVWMFVMLASCDRDRPAEPTAMPAPVEAAFELTPLEHKLMRIDLALARIDPSFHSLRIQWPDEAVDRWQWPTWVTQKRQVEILDELLSAAGTRPAVPALDLAVSDYARQMTTDGQALEQLVIRWGSVVEAHPATNRPNRAEVVPILTRFSAASHRVHGALRVARPVDRFVPGSKLALYRVCTDALATMADMPPRSQDPPADVAAVASRRARACIRAAIDYLDLRARAAPPTGEDNLYVADLATKIGMYMLKDADRLTRRLTDYSSSHNISQVATFFAEEFKTVVTPR
jgi:hypothetical protein